MKNILTLAFLLAATPAFAATGTETATTEMSVRQEVGLNVKDEALAIRNLARVLRREVERGKLELTPEAKGRWEEGVRIWDTITARAEAESYHAAYTEVREVRRLMADTVTVAFNGKPTPQLRKALVQYMDAVSDRVTNARDYRTANPVNAEAEACFRKGEAAWTQARTLSGNGHYALAYNTVLDGMDELDQMLRHVYEDKKLRR